MENYVVEVKEVWKDDKSEWFQDLKLSTYAQLSSEDGTP